jgi:hypothetical protein
MDWNVSSYIAFNLVGFLSGSMENYNTPYNCPCRLHHPAQTFQDMVLAFS